MSIGDSKDTTSKRVSVNKKRGVKDRDSEEVLQDVLYWISFRHTEPNSSLMFIFKCELDMVLGHPEDADIKAVA